MNGWIWVLFVAGWVGLFGLGYVLGGLTRNWGKRR